MEDLCNMSNRRFVDFYYLYSEFFCGRVAVCKHMLVMVHNPAHDLFSIGHFLCRVRVVDCCDLRNGAERQ